MLLKQLLPQMIVNSIYEIDLEALKNRGIKGIITDLDNTLIGAKDTQASPELEQWLRLVRESGFKVVVVSNNRRKRVSQFAEPLNLPYIYKAKKPIRMAFRRAMRIMEVLPGETVVIGDQLLTDVLGGNRMGLYTILVMPIAPRDEKWFTRVNRVIEKYARKWMKKKGFTVWEDRP